VALFLGAESPLPPLNLSVEWGNKKVNVLLRSSIEAHVSSISL